MSYNVIVVAWVTLGEHAIVALRRDDHLGANPRGREFTRDLIINKGP